MKHYLKLKPEKKWKLQTAKEANQIEHENRPVFVRAREKCYNFDRLMGLAKTTIRLQRIFTKNKSTTELNFNSPRELQFDDVILCDLDCWYSTKAQWNKIRNKWPVDGIIAVGGVVVVLDMDYIS